MYMWQCACGIANSLILAINGYFVATTLLVLATDGKEVHVQDEVLLLSSIWTQFQQKSGSYSCI